MDTGTIPRVLMVSFTISNCIIICPTTQWRSRRMCRRTLVEIPVQCSLKGWRYQRYDTYGRVWFFHRFQWRLSIGYAKFWCREWCIIIKLYHCFNNCLFYIYISKLIFQFYAGLQPIGAENRFTVLNVLGENIRQSYYMVDSLDTGKISTDYYKDNELGIGAEINVFGRRIIITDMDAFTKEYYR